MKCPVCQTQNPDAGKEQCTQCGADIQVHRLLHQLQEKLAVPPSSAPGEQKSSQAPVSLGFFFQVLPSILLLVCALFGIFVGIRFLSTIDRIESQRTTLVNRWSETGFEQLKKINTMMKQEFDFILEQRQENLKLQEKIQVLTENKTQEEAASP